MNDFYKNIANYFKQIQTGFGQLKTFRLSSLGKVFSLMGKKEKIALLALLAVAFISLFFSLRNFYYNHTAPAPAFGGSFTEGLLGQPAYINPILAHTETDLALTRLVFAGLYKFNNQGELVPDLAAGLPEISADQKEYTISLKPGLKWHNDRPLSADDVLFTIQTVQNPGYKSPYFSLWQATTVEKISELKVKFKTKDVSGPFLQNLTLPIVSKFLWAKTEPQQFLLSPQNLKAIGSGPYQIKEIKSAEGKVQEIALISFADYHNGRPNIEKLTLKFYDSAEEILNALHGREISGLGFTASGNGLYLEKRQKNLQIFSLPLPQYQTVFFNLNSKIFAEDAVRKALSLSANGQTLAKEVFKDNVLPPASPFLFADKTPRPSEFSENNLEAAKAVLASAGWKLDAKTGLLAKKNRLLEFTLTTSDSPQNSKAAALLSAEWSKLGVKVNLNILPSKQLSETVIKPRNFEALLYSLKIGSDPDPFFFWHSNQIKDPGLNLSGFNSPLADKLISEARTTTDKDARHKKYQELDKLVGEAVPAIFLNQAVYVYGIDKNIKNFALRNLFEPSQRFWGIENWHIETKRVWK